MQTIVRHASETDLRAVMELLALKAEFDGCRDARVATEEQLRQAFFSSSPRAQVLLAEVEGQAIGLATFFQTFSTYLAKPGIWLDDLYVREEYRSRGVGKALLVGLARSCRGAAPAQRRRGVPPGARSGSSRRPVPCSSTATCS